MVGKSKIGLIFRFFQKVIIKVIMNYLVKIRPLFEDTYIQQNFIQRLPYTIARSIPYAKA